MVLSEDALLVDSRHSGKSAPNPAEFGIALALDFITVFMFALPSSSRR